MPSEYNGPILPVNAPRKKKSSAGGPGTILMLIIIAVLAVLILKSALKKEETYVPGTVKDVNAWAYIGSTTATPEPGLAPTAEADSLVPVYYNANTTKRRIAITVQDISNASDLDDLLGLCATYGFNVTFFLTGADLSNYASMWPAAVLGGNEIESRGISAVELSRLDDNEMSANLDTFTASLRLLIGTEYQPHFFRPESLDDYDNLRLQQALRQRGYYGIASWSLASPGNISQIEPGQIVQISLSSYGMTKFKNLLAALSTNGYKAVTLNSLFEYPENIVSTDAG